MSAERKISDEDLDRLRDLADEGVPPSALAEGFQITVQHVRRLLRGEQRPSIAGLDPETVQRDVVRAVDEFLADADHLSAADAVLAATARVLALKVDAVASSSSAAAAQAMPRLAAELASVLAALRDGVPREPDDVDLLRARRAARLAGREATDGPHFNNGNKRGKKE